MIYLLFSQICAKIDIEHERIGNVMKSGNLLLRGCLFIFGGLFLLALLIELAVPLAICVGIGFAVYYLYRRWRYPLLRDHSLADQIELLKARIKQADKDIKELDTTLEEGNTNHYRPLSQQVLIEIESIHKEATRLKPYLEDDVYQRIDKKVREVRATIQVQLEQLEQASTNNRSTSYNQYEIERLAPELSETLKNITIDHQAILNKIMASNSGNKEELTAVHQLDMERFEKILQGYLKIKSEPKNIKNADERLAQAKAAIEQFDLDLDYVLQTLNEAEMRDLDLNIRMMSKKSTENESF